MVKEDDNVITTANSTINYSNTTTGWDSNTITTGTIPYTWTTTTVGISSI